MRKILLAMFLISFGPFIGFGLLIGCGIVWGEVSNQRFFAQHPLVAGLPQDSTASAVFQRRVDDRFPPGTSSEKLVRDLAAQGFGTTIENLTCESTHSVQLTKLGDLAEWGRRDWIVTWRVDRHGGVTGLRATFFETVS